MYCIYKLVTIHYADFSKYSGLLKLKDTKNVCMCMLCFKSDKVELAKCLFETHNFSPSSLWKHLNRHHSAEDAPDFFKLSKAALIQQEDGIRTCRATEVTDGNYSIRTFFNSYHHKKRMNYGVVKLTNTLIVVVFHFEVLLQRSLEN
jgi:hypothetical protein